MLACFRWISLGHVSHGLVPVCYIHVHVYKNQVLHSELVAEIKDEPDYEAALRALA